MANRDPDKESDWDDFRADDWHGFDRSTWSYRYDHRYDDGDGYGGGGGGGCGCGIILTFVISFVITVILGANSVLDPQNFDRDDLYIILAISAFISWRIIAHGEEIFYFFVEKVMPIVVKIIIVLIILMFFGIVK